MTKEELEQLVRMLCKFVAAYGSECDSAADAAKLIERALRSDGWSR